MSIVNIMSLNNNEKNPCNNLKILNRKQIQNIVIKIIENKAMISTMFKSGTISLFMDVKKKNKMKFCDM